MIYYLVGRAQQYHMRLFLNTFGKSMSTRMTVLPYERLFRMKSLPIGTYIFAAFQELEHKDTVKAAAVWNKLAEHGHGVRLLNHPTRSMRRFELLRHLHEAGINEFDVYRLTECRLPKKYPVFIRSEVLHSGSLTPLLHDETELQAAMDRLTASGECREDKLIVEFVDTAEERARFRYHMYTAMVIGTRIVPVDYAVDDQWVVKKNRSTESSHVDAVAQYVDTNPHEEALQSIAKMARMDYGRIDYAVVDGRVQVFEINSGPFIVVGDVGHPIWEPITERYASKVLEALEEIDCPEPARKCIRHLPTRRHPAYLQYCAMMSIHNTLRILRLSKYEDIALAKVNRLYRRWASTLRPNGRHVDLQDSPGASWPATTSGNP